VTLRVPPYSLLLYMNSLRIRCQLYLYNIKKININDIDLRNASYVEMSALEAYYDVDRGNSLSSFPQETGHMGLNERCDLISSFEKVIQDMNKLGKYDLQMFYMRNMNTYLNLERQKKA